MPSMEGAIPMMMFEVTNHEEFMMCKLMMKSSIIINGKGRAKQEGFRNLPRRVEKAETSHDP
jgi:hypothetical protein